MGITFCVYNFEPLNFPKKKFRVSHGSLRPLVIPSIVPHTGLLLKQYTVKDIYIYIVVGSVPSMAAANSGKQ